MFLREDEEIPCDMCMLSSSDPAGNCFIQVQRAALAAALADPLPCRQTTNLDGESNLKVRTARESTRELASDHTLREFRGAVTCAPPNDELYKFDSQCVPPCACFTPVTSTICLFLCLFVCLPPRARAGVGGARVRLRALRLRLDPSDPGCPVESLSADQLLLQATHLRNTEFVFGLVVYARIGVCHVPYGCHVTCRRYAGNETKFGNNKRVPGMKLTATDKLIDRYSLAIFLFQLFITVIFGIVGDVLLVDDMKSKWYLRYPLGALPTVQWLFIPLRFLLLNSTMIPISLKVICVSIVI